MHHSYTRTRNLQYTPFRVWLHLYKGGKKILSKGKKKGKKKKIEKKEGW
jgi:hypothetical protein